MIYIVQAFFVLAMLSYSIRGRVISETATITAKANKIPPLNFVESTNRSNFLKKLLSSVYALSLLRIFFIKLIMRTTTITGKTGIIAEKTLKYTRRLSNTASQPYEVERIKENPVEYDITPINTHRKKSSSDM